MDKPSWDDAPEWAQWHATDGYGAVWFEFEPEIVDGMWCDPLEGKIETYSYVEYKCSKERRP